MTKEDRDQNEVDIKRFSPYYLPSCLPSDLISKENFWGIEPECTSLFAKFEGLVAMLELFASQDIHFPIICI